MANTIQHKRGTASQWTTLNPLLANGELGLETDTHKFKFGDGVTYWNALDYAGGGGGDLSNYYTKTEVNNLLNEKADSFTTDYPLELSTITVGGLHNMTIDSYNRPINSYQTALTYESYSASGVDLQNSSLSNSPSTLDGYFGGDCSYFDIPTDFGARISTATTTTTDKIVMNCGTINSSYYPMFIWGYKDNQGNFKPVAFQRAYYTGGMFACLVDSVENKDTNSIYLKTSVYADSASTYTQSGDVGYTACLQYNFSTGRLYSEVRRQQTATVVYNTGAGSTDASYVAEARKINMVRVFAYQNGGFPPTSIKYYINNVATDWTIQDAAKTSTSLSLNYDDTCLGVSNNQLTVVGKQDTLVSGTNIKTVGGTSLLGSGNIDIYSRNIGEIVQSTIPLTDAGLHLLDGALISGSGSYSAFVDYLADKYGSTEVAWTQPVLTSNGTLGGDSFAVYASNSYNGTTYPIYKSFDGDSSTIWYDSSVPVDVIFYNPKPLKVTNIQCQNRTDANNYAFTAGTVYGSNDNITYTQIDTFTNSDTTQGSTWDIDLSGNTNAYLYYKISFSSATQAGVGANFTITATYINYPSYFCTEEQWQTSVNTHGVCGKFVYDSVNNTVRLPKYNSKIYTGGGIANVEQDGLLKLTNTIGSTPVASNIRAVAGSTLTSTNDLSYVASGTGSWGGQNLGYYSGLLVDLSSITTSLDGYYYIVIANTTKTQIQVDIDEIATDLNGKADVDLSNATDTADIRMAHNAMPSGTYVDLTLGASGATYTAPADGYYYLNKVPGNDWYYINGTVKDTNDNTLYSMWSSDYRTSPLSIFLPVKKGNKITITYNATGTTNYFRFIYANGSESEAS